MVWRHHSEQKGISTVNSCKGWEDLVSPQDWVHESAYPWVCQHFFDKAKKKKKATNSPTKRKAKPKPAKINTQTVIRPPIAFLADPHIEFISSPNFSEWSIFLGDMSRSTLFLSRKLSVRNQGSSREKLLLQFFFQDGLCSKVSRGINVEFANS